MPMYKQPRPKNAAKGYRYYKKLASRSKGQIDPYDAPYPSLGGLGDDDDLGDTGIAPLDAFVSSIGAKSQLAEKALNVAAGASVVAAIGTIAILWRLYK